MLTTNAVAAGPAPPPDGPVAAAEGGTPPSDGRTARWDDHRRARREELLDGVIAAVREHGAEVGMDRIAAAVGTSKAGVYRYFADKDDLNRCVGRRLATAAVGGIQAAVHAQTDDRTMLVAGIDAYLDLLEDDPQLYRFVVHGSSADSLDSDYTSMVDDLIVGIFTTRLGRLELDTSAARPWGIAVVGAVRAVGDWWLAHPDVPRHEVSDYLTALLWNGMSGAHLPSARAS